jgi:hypothetical protein
MMTKRRVQFRSDFLPETIRFNSNDYLGFGGFCVQIRDMPDDGEGATGRRGRPYLHPLRLHQHPEPLAWLFVRSFARTRTLRRRYFVLIVSPKIAYSPDNETSAIQQYVIASTSAAR